MKYHDPATGGQLSRGEWMSWKIQHVMRRWSFIGAISIITAIAWATNNPIVLSWWNLSASYMALMIESIVGMAMFNQCIRDAVVSRQTRANSQRIEVIEGQNAALLDEIRRISQHNEQQLAQLSNIEEKMLAILQRQEEITGKL